ncbi:MAG TPA: NAD(P)H-dependent oxidoreductase [Eoetvoesiella sp.]|uniref:FMN-dependent NADH-azoreductase n=1 Tax=Eoetvoesiella sp. TaxID=1966355 RepID=UPI002CEBE7FF|nr:NAD(P)H-dependent oxidoreductase [Eoetvoesiella sp.]HWK62355.1 NAD(P)H-dependent oxidoreductase [Eoetvoesiella sp.]
MNLLHIACSPRGAQSESYRLSLEIIAHMEKRHGETPLAIEKLNAGTLAHVDVEYADAVGYRVEPPGGPFDPGSLSQSEQLIRTLENADTLVIATPMHNYTVPSGLKAWIDHVVRVRRSFRSTPQGKVGILPDRPVFVAVSSGGRYSGENARQPDFLTPYLKAALATIGLKDVTFFSVEGTALDNESVAASRRLASRAMAEHFEVMT